MKWTNLIESFDLIGVNMKTVTANEAKTHFGELIMSVQSAPVRINKNGKPVAVMMSVEEYELIEHMKLEALKARLKASEEQARAGLLHDGETVFTDILAGKYD